MLPIIEKFIVNLILRELTPENASKIEAAVASFIVCELTAFAAKTPTDIDDQVIARVASLLGVVCPAPAPAA